MLLKELAGVLHTDMVYIQDGRQINRYAKPYGPLFRRYGDRTVSAIIPDGYYLDIELAAIPVQRTAARANAGANPTC